MERVVGSDWGSEQQEPECEASENVFFSLNGFGCGRGIHCPKSPSEGSVNHNARQSNASSRATAGGSNGKVGGRPPADPAEKPVSADFGPLLWSGCETSEAASPKKGRYVKMIFDSGAGCTAMPASVGEGYPIAQDEWSGEQYGGAMDGMRASDEGRRTIQIVDARWKPMKMRHRVVEKMRPVKR